MPGEEQSAFSGVEEEDKGCGAGGGWIVNTKDQQLALIEERKVEGCKLCGSKDSLHFHHVRSSDKSFSISKRTKLMTKERLQFELDKCVVLCRPCHMRVHRGHIGRGLLDLNDIPVNNEDYEEKDPYVLAVLLSMEGQ